MHLSIVNKKAKFKRVFVEIVSISLFIDLLPVRIANIKGIDSLKETNVMTMSTWAMESIVVLCEGEAICTTHQI